MDETALRANLTKALKEGLDEKGWSQNELCRQAGISESSVKNILSGKSEHPRIVTVFKIATALEKTVGEFIGEPPQYLNSKASQLLELFDQVTDENRNRILEIAAAWAGPPPIKPGDEIEATDDNDTVLYRGPERRVGGSDADHDGPERRSPAHVRRL